MLLLVRIDLAQADLGPFEEYETRVLALLPKYGARVEERLRSADGRDEVHLLYFPDAAALDAFRGDATRTSLQALWRQSGAQSTLGEVMRMP